MNTKKTRFIAQAAMLAALYVVLTYASMLLGLDKGVIQCRLSEALGILPIFTNAATPGLFLGCLISNLITGCALWDIVFGSLATLVASLITAKLRTVPYLASVPTIAMNTLVIPPLLAFVYNVDTALPIIYITVFLGELLSCGFLGTLLLTTIKKYRKSTI